MPIKFSPYFYNSQKAHEQHAFNAAMKGDTLKMIYHNTVIEEQTRQKRVLSRVAKQIIFLKIYQSKIEKEVEKYDPYKSWADERR